MTFSTFQTLRGYLPHEAAQFLYRRVRPSRSLEYENLNIIPRSENSPISFAPLHETSSIFVHVPKAAGTSVGHYLYGCRTGDHMTLLDYRTALPKPMYKSAFKFTFVRNPWDRLVSAYFYLKSDERSPFDRKQAAGSVLLHETFEEFVSEFVARKNINAFIHLKEQHLFLRLPGRRIGVDFVGKFERLNDDFAVIAQRLGKDTTLQHRNASTLRKTDYRDIYTPKMVDIVAKTYAKDIAYFGYSFDGPT